MIGRVQAIEYNRMLGYAEFVKCVCDWPSTRTRVKWSLVKRLISRYTSEPVAPAGNQLCISLRGTLIYRKWRPLFAVQESSSGAEQLNAVCLEHMLHSAAFCVHALNVFIVELGCSIEVAHFCVDVCDGAVGICVSDKVVHLLADLQHPQQVLNGCLVLPLQSQA